VGHRRDPLVQAPPCATRVACGNQDEAQVRCLAKSLVRFLVWSAAYSCFDWALSIGRLNRVHLLRHGFALDRILPAPYCVNAAWADILGKLRSNGGLNSARSLD